MFIVQGYTAEIHGHENIYFFLYLLNNNTGYGIYMYKLNLVGYVRFKI